MEHHPQSIPKVHVIDDDGAFRQSLENLLSSADVAVESYASPKSFIDQWTSDAAGCVLLDIRFPGMNGLDFLDLYRDAQIGMPVILMTGHADVPSSVRGLKGGAVDYLMKPFDEDALLAAVRSALERDARRCAERDGLADLVDRYRSLTMREKEVLALVSLGLMNKQIANRVELSEITVKVHRGTMMKKLGMRTVADLVRAYEVLKSAPVELVAPPGR
jgi:FixJ family two-component response regulator